MDLTSADFPISFTFARRDPRSYRDATGALVEAAVDEPRFDHSAAGDPKGLLVQPGVTIGGADRVAIDPLILPLDLVGPDAATGAPVTILHRFDPGTGVEQRAWYSRAVVKTINALMLQAGHHLAIGVVRDFLEPEFDGTDWLVTFRNSTWRLPSAILTEDEAAVSGVLLDGEGRALILAGADQI